MKIRTPTKCPITVFKSLFFQNNITSLLLKVRLVQQEQELQRRQPAQQIQQQPSQIKEEQHEQVQGLTIDLTSRH